MILKFVGAECVISGIAKLKFLGQQVEIADNLVPSLCDEKGAALIPAKDFDAIGFTPDELRKYGTFAARAAAPEEFFTKLRSAWAKLDEFRQSLKEA